MFFDDKNEIKRKAFQILIYEFFFHGKNKMKFELPNKNAKINEKNEQTQHSNTQDISKKKTKNNVVTQTKYTIELVPKKGSFENR